MGRNSRYAAKRQRIKTSKLIDKITFNPSIHKQKNRRKLREELQRRSFKPHVQPIDIPEMRFGSFNVKGVDLETSDALQSLILAKDFDVGSTFINIFIYLD